MGLREGPALKILGAKNNEVHEPELVEKAHVYRTVGQMFVMNTRNEQA